MILKWSNRCFTDLLNKKVTT